MPSAAPNGLPALFGTVALMWTLAVVLPGPNFLGVARIATTRDRAAGLAAVAGIGAGTACWGLAGCFGLHIMFAAAPWLYGTLKLLGAAYLIVMGVRIVAGSFGPPASSGGAPSARSAARAGLLTSLSNPKSALLVGSLFAVALPQGASLGTGLAVVAEMVTISVAWYTAVALLFTTRTAAAAFAAGRRWIDRIAGAVFVAFGARLALEG